MYYEYMTVGDNKVSVSDDKGNLDLRDSTNNLVVILENENLKEEIENNLFLLRRKKIDIKNYIESYKKDNKIEFIISLALVGLFIIASIKFNLFPIILNEIGNVGFWVIGGMLTWGGIATSKIRRDIRSELERKSLVCDASVTMLEHLLEKTNTKLKELKESDEFSKEFSYDKTKVSTTKIDDLNIKLNLIDKFRNNPDDVMVKHGEMYALRNNNDRTLIDEEEREIISYCQNACRITNMKRVLQRTMR